MGDAYEINPGEPKDTVTRFTCPACGGRLQAEVYYSKGVIRLCCGCAEAFKFANPHDFYLNAIIGGLFISQSYNGGRYVIDNTESGRHRFLRLFEIWGCKQIKSYLERWAVVQRYMRRIDSESMSVVKLAEEKEQKRRKQK